MLRELIDENDGRSPGLRLREPTEKRLAPAAAPNDAKRFAPQGTLRVLRNEPRVVGNNSRWRLAPEKGVAEL